MLLLINVIINLCSFKSGVPRYLHICWFVKFESYTVEYNKIYQLVSWSSFGLYRITPPPSWTAFNHLVILKEWFLILWIFIVINLILAGAWWGEIAGTVVLCVVYSVRIIAVDWNLESKQVWKVKMRWIKSIILV